MKGDLMFQMIPFTQLAPKIINISLKYGAIYFRLIVNAIQVDQV